MILQSSAPAKTFLRSRWPEIRPWLPNIGRVCYALSKTMSAHSFAPLQSMQLPSRSEAHIWYVVPNEVKDESLLKNYMELLPQCEKDNVLLMEGELQKGALLARTLIRTTLSRYTDFTKHPKSFKFKKNKFGKPEVDWQFDDLSVHKALQFNISHSSSLIACGVTANKHIGIDVEEKIRRPSRNILSLANRYFTPEEIKHISSFGDSESQRKEFIKLWTLKEAYVKAIGRGFSGAPFREFTIRCEGSKDLIVNGPESALKVVIEAGSNYENHTNNWEFALLDLDSSHYLAVCVEKDKNTSMEDYDDPLKLKVWKTMPFLEDVCMSETDALLTINGLV